jgi:hypothetical protein
VGVHCCGERDVLKDFAPTSAHYSDKNLAALGTTMLTEFKVYTKARRLVAVVRGRRAHDWWLALPNNLAFGDCVECAVSESSCTQHCVVLYFAPAGTVLAPNSRVYPWVDRGGTAEKDNGRNAQSGQSSTVALQASNETTVQSGLQCAQKWV